MTRMPFEDDDTVPIEGVLIYETERAFLLETEHEELWWPKSKCMLPADAEEGDTIIVDVPEWLARKNGLI